MIPQSNTTADQRVATSRPSPSNPALLDVGPDVELADRLNFDQAIGDVLTVERAARRLYLDSATVRLRARRGALVLLSDGNTEGLPTWQFRGRATVLGLSTVIALYPGTLLDLCAWATQPSPHLRGLTPAEELRLGGILLVRRLIETIRAAG